MAIRIDIVHEPRDWYEGGDRYYVHVRDDSDTEFVTGWPLALCPTQAAAELIRDSVKKHPKRLADVAKELR